MEYSRGIRKDYMKFEIYGLLEVQKLTGLNERKIQRDCASGKLEAYKINLKDGNPNTGTWAITSRALKAYCEREGIELKV